MSKQAKREGKYLAAFGAGTAYPSNYGIYVEQSDGLLPTENFLVGSSFCLPGQEHEPHSHPEHDEIIVFQGSVGIQTVGDDEVYEVHDNDLVYIPAGIPHSIRNDSNLPLRMTIIKVNKGRVQK